MARNLSLIIIAGNEEEMIADCLKSANFAEEIILVAANSNDQTLTIAKKIITKIKIIKVNDEYNKHFAKWRNLGYQAATKKWLFYLDADERISPFLRDEILKVTSTGRYTHYAVPRANFFLGQRVKYGGTYPDYVKRLFKREKFKGYQGILHEEPIVTGQIGYLKNDLLHYTHRSLSSMLQKSIAWTDMEAQALYRAKHPPVTWWRILRMFFTKLHSRLITQQMFRDGTVGWISSFFEAFDTFLIYARLWERQQQLKIKNYE